MDRAADAAAILGATDAHDAQLRRNPVEHLARRLADRMEAAAAARTVMALHIEPHILPRQMVGKRRASRCGAGIRVGIVRRRRGVTGFRAGDIGIEVLESEGQLVGIEALGAASELPPLKLFDEALEAFNLVVAGLDGGRHVAHQAVQKVDVGGQVLKVETHERV